ncbi:MAG: CopG family transcriptional regulator [Ilumatobacteraceae bacterium]
MRRTQIYLDDDQHALLDERAADLGTTKSDVIREAIDRYLGRSAGDAAAAARWRAAVTESFGIAPGLDDGAAYTARLRDADAARMPGRRR